MQVLFMSTYTGIFSAVFECFLRYLVITKSYYILKLIFAISRKIFQTLQKQTAKSVYFILKQKQRLVDIIKTNITIQKHKFNKDPISFLIFIAPLKCVNPLTHKHMF